MNTELQNFWLIWLEFNFNESGSPEQVSLYVNAKDGISLEIMKIDSLLRVCYYGSLQLDQSEVSNQMMAVL